MTKTRILGVDTAALRDPAVYDRIYQALPEKRRAAADRFRNADDRLRSAAAGALLLRLCEEEGLSPDMPDLTENAYGKPYFSEHPDVCFSLSHSGSKVMLAVSDRPIGCDVEFRTQGKWLAGIARRFFTPEEGQLLEQETDPEEKRRLFYRLWTLKESFVKKSGLGLYLPLQSFRIVLSENDPVSVLLIDPPQDADVPADVCFSEFDFGDGYAYACCADPGAGKITFDHIGNL